MKLDLQTKHSMKTENKTPLGYGFTLTESHGGEVLPQEEALSMVSQIARLDEIGTIAQRLHYYSKRLLEFLDEGRKQFRRIGQDVKITSHVPITAIRYQLVSKDEMHVYRFIAPIYHRDQCSFEHTVPWKFKDYFQSEFKSMFNVAYTIELDENDKPYMKRKTYPHSARVKELIGTFKEIDHPAFVLQGIKGIVPIVPDRVYKGRFFQMELKLKESGNFTFNFKSNKVSGDSAVLTYEEGRFHMTLIQPVLKAPLEVTDDLLFELIHCIISEYNHEFSDKRQMNKSKDHHRN